MDVPPYVEGMKCGACYIPEAGVFARENSEAGT
jgi:hypothetical protein